MATRYIVTCVEELPTKTRAWADTLAMAMRQEQQLERLTGKAWHITKETKPDK